MHLYHHVAHRSERVLAETPRPADRLGRALLGSRRRGRGHRKVHSDASGRTASRGDGHRCRRRTLLHGWSADAISPDLVVDLSSENDPWSAFGCLWSRLALSLHPTVKPPFESASEDSRRNLAVALAKLERNLVAGIAEHQVQAVYATLQGKLRLAY